MTLTKRLVKGAALTHAEGDANLDHLVLSSNHTFTQSGTAPTYGFASRTAAAKMSDFYNVKDFKCADGTAVTGDGSHNDTTGIQSAIDWISATTTAGSAMLYFPPGDYLISALNLKQGVLLWGIYGLLSIPWTPKATRLVSDGTAGVMVNASAANCLGVVGLGFQGSGAGTALKGIRFQTVLLGIIQFCTFNGFADEEVLLDSGTIACRVLDNFGQNGLLNRTRSAVNGVCDIDGTDHRVERNEWTASLSAVSSASLFCAAMVIRGSNHRSIIGNVCEISDIGLYIACTKSFISGNSVELNLGHGGFVTDTSNRIIGNSFLNNSQDTTNTYDNFQATSASGNNVIGGNEFISTTAKVARYNVNDAVNSASNKNRYGATNSVSGAGTANWNISTNNGSASSIASGSMLTLTANSATPSVEGSERFTTANSNPTTWTNFTGGVQGQRNTIFVNDSNTTVQHNGATISTFNAGSVKLVSGRMYVFVLQGSLWRMEWDHDDTVNADVGDSAKSLQARVSETTQIWATAITADRAVTLSTTGAYSGAKFRIVRAATATGAFNLNVGTGPLKAMNTAGSFCDVEYNGSAWVLTAYGTL